MRFAAKYRRYKVTAREHVKMTLANGKENIIQNGVVCAFSHGGPFQAWEREQALGKFKFRGTTQERDEATPVDPSGRLALFDTDTVGLVKQWEAWDVSENQPKGTIKREVEEFLLSYPANGIDYMQLIPIPLTAPWPTYDELTIHGQRKAAHVAERNVEIAQATGIPLEDVIAYEKENRNNELIVATYEEALAAMADPEEELVEA